MREHVIPSEPAIVVSLSDNGDIVLEQVDGEVRIPPDKIHQVTVWMRRLAAQLQGLLIIE